ncbi:hypothetical protein [Frigoriglobus tundricola]|uniref:Uncharacterized protein n=1 Tax=Frigoriglobus tundricola TaxID=2774151 RepID=A0A6M5Z1D8_9BACT|nr:hypothetical protein [Frigoriglobus tundricola]QJW99460.1 hypothetical protein FTUN_7072 [Frigoriglobus tundricola]
MSRLFVAAALALSVCAVSTADEPKKEKATVDLFASVEDETLKKEAPESDVIVSAKAWEKLAKAWGIKDPAKVDFAKEILVVQTTVGSRLTVTTKLDDTGDLKVLGIATRDLRPGFRYAIKSVSKEGVKTVNGKELPKE